MTKAEEINKAIRDLATVEELRDVLATVELELRIKEASELGLETQEEIHNDQG